MDSVFRQSVMSVMNILGTALGTVLALPISGFTAQFLGWEAVFYSQGALCFLW